MQTTCKAPKFYISAFKTGDGENSVPRSLKWNIQLYKLRYIYLCKNSCSSLYLSNNQYWNSTFFNDAYKGSFYKYLSLHVFTYIFVSVQSSPYAWLR